MASVDGDWDVTIKSPMGDQKAVLTVNSDGASFSGKMVGGLGAMDIPSENTLRAHAPGPQGPMQVQYNAESVTGWTWPLASRHVTVIELGE